MKLTLESILPLIAYYAQLRRDIHQGFFLFPVNQHDFKKCPVFLFILKNTTTNKINEKFSDLH